MARSGPGSASSGVTVSAALTGARAESISRTASSLTDSDRPNGQRRLGAGSLSSTASDPACLATATSARSHSTVAGFAAAGAGTASIERPAASRASLSLSSLFGNLSNPTRPQRSHARQGLSSGFRRSEAAIAVEQAARRADA